MDFTYTPEQEAYRMEVRGWLEANQPPPLRPEEKDRVDENSLWERLKLWHKKLHEGGWAGLTWPKEFGGRGATFVERGEHVTVDAEDKVLEVKKEVLNARSDINQANQDSDAEYQQFKTKQDNRIMAFEKSIAELQANYATNNNGRKAFIVTKLAALEQSKSDN